MSPGPSPHPIVLVVHNADSDPVGRLGDWLRAAGLELRVLDGPDLPPDLDGYAGLVVLGGPMGATDDSDAPWLPHLRTLLRAAVTAEVPTLGVCLGAQLLAAAHGGEVVANPEGPELGAQLVAKRSAASLDPLFRGVPITPDVIQWHYDTIRRLPAGAIQLASSAVCENQAFRLGRLAWGIQFHVETTPQVVAHWAATDAARLGADFGLAADDLERIVARAEAVHDDIDEVWSSFAGVFADIVRDPGSVPRARGVPTSTAAPVSDPAAIRAALAAEAEAARAPMPAGPMPLPMPGRRPPRDDRGD